MLSVKISCQRSRPAEKPFAKQLADMFLSAATTFSLQRAVGRRRLSGPRVPLACTACSRSTAIAHTSEHGSIAVHPPGRLRTLASCLTYCADTA